MSLVVNFLTNPKMGDFVQNSTCQVLSEGCLKAVGRPVFTLKDKTATPEEKKYSATKEFIYQSLSMMAYFAMIFPIKNNSYKLLKHLYILNEGIKMNSSKLYTILSSEKMISVVSINIFLSSSFIWQPCGLSGPSLP